MLLSSWRPTRGVGHLLPGTSGGRAMVVMILFGIQACGDRAHYIGIFCGVLLFCQNSDVHMYLSTYWEVKKKTKEVMNATSICSGCGTLPL